jgi:hypothetical protein
MLLAGTTVLRWDISKLVACGLASFPEALSLWIGAYFGNGQGSNTTVNQRVLTQCLRMTWAHDN